MSNIPRDDIDDILEDALDQYEFSVEQEHEEVKKYAVDSAAENASQRCAKSEDMDSMIHEMEKLLGELKSELSSITGHSGECLPAQQASVSNESSHEPATNADAAAHELLKKFSDIENSLQGIMKSLPDTDENVDTDQQDKNMNAKAGKYSQEELLAQINEMQKQWDLFQ